MNAKWMMISLALMVFTAGCSHVTPYYRNGMAEEGPVTVSPAEVRTRIVLIGDAGEPARGKPVLALLEKWSGELPGKTAVIFLGDNIYPAGLPEPTASGRAEAQRRLAVQLEAVRNSRARGIVIPGNHDWANGGASGAAAVRRQAAFVMETLASDSAFLPHAACPGPVKVDLPGVRIVVIDTHWWLQPPIVSEDCPHRDEAAIIAALQEMVTTAGKREVVLVGHHPFATRGPHGGFFTWKDHLFPLTNLVEWLWIPLPLIGSLYPLGRWYLVKSPQDMNGRLNKKMRRLITQAVAEKPPLVFASGHEHALQVFQKINIAAYVLVSGAGSPEKINPVGHNENTLFAHAHSGFMVLDLLQDRRVLLRVVEPGKREVVFVRWLR